MIRNLRTASRAPYGLVALVNEPVDQINGFIDHHLKYGADHIIIYFDDSNHPAVRQTRVSDRVSIVACTKSFWSQAGGNEVMTLDEKLHICQRVGFEKLRRLGIEWLLLMDADELLYSPVSIRDELTKIPTRVDQVRVPVVEAIHTAESRDKRPFAPRQFKQYQKKLQRHQLMEISARSSDIMRFTRNGFFGHTYGKTFTRSNIDLNIFHSHRPKSSRSRLKMRQAKYMTLLHFDAMSFSDWRRKWSRRIDGSTNCVTISPFRREQHRAIAEALYGGDRALNGLFDTWYLYDESDLARLIDLDLAFIIDEDRLNARWASLAAERFKGKQIRKFVQWLHRAKSLFVGQAPLM